MSCLTATPSCWTCRSIRDPMPGSTSRCVAAVQLLCTLSVKPTTTWADPKTGFAAAMPYKLHPLGSLTEPWTGAQAAVGLDLTCLLVGGGGYATTLLSVCCLSPLSPWCAHPPAQPPNLPPTNRPTAHNQPPSHRVAACLPPCFLAAAGSGVAV